MNEATVEFLMSSNLLEPALQFFEKLAPEGIGALRSPHHFGRTHPTKGVRPFGWSPFPWGQRPTDYHVK